MGSASALTVNIRQPITVVAWLAARNVEPAIFIRRTVLDASKALQLRVRVVYARKVVTGQWWVLNAYAKPGSVRIAMATAKNVRRCFTIAKSVTRRPAAPNAHCLVWC